MRCDPGYRRKWQSVILICLVAPFYCSSSSAQDAGEENADAAGRQIHRRYVISRETTRVTGPLLEDGSIDFIEAINQEFSRGVTRNNNAAAMILPVLPVEDWDPDHRETLLRRLESEFVNMDPPSMESVNEFCRNNELDYYAEFERKGANPFDTPWSVREFPQLAALLGKNKAALDEIVEATQLEHYYVPLVNGEAGPLLIGFVHKEYGGLREAARQLNYRAMNRIHKKQWEAAWSDILAIKRLGTMTGSGMALIDGLVGNAISGIACDAAARFIAYAADEPGIPWSDKSRQWSNEFQVADIARQVDFAERFVFIQIILVVAEHDDESAVEWFSAMSVPGLDLDSPEIPEIPRTFESVFDALNGDDQIDWNEGLRWCNTCFDRMIENFAISDPEQRMLAFIDLKKKLKRIKDSLPDSLLALSSEIDRAARGRIVTGAMLALAAPDVTTIVMAELRARTSQNVVYLGLRSLEFRDEFERLPASLAELSEHFEDIKAIDFRDGETLEFISDDKKIVIYHSGRNGRYEGWTGKSPGSDDWGVEIPR